MNIPFRILKLYTLCLTSVLVVFFSQKIIVACGGYDEGDILDYSSFAPEIIDQPKYSPYFFTYEELYPADPAYAETSSDEFNINEWYAYFDEKITKEDLTWFIYGSTVKELEVIQKTLINTSGLPDTLKQKSLINLRLKKEMAELFNYLTLTKNAEHTFNPNYYDWYEPVLHDSEKAVTFQEPFLKGLTGKNSLFLKHRFGFQLIRAYYYSGQYEKAASVMNMMPALKAKSGSIFYRALGYKAAALYSLNSYKESNLIYAQLFDEYEPLRLSSCRSFHLLDDSAWNSNLAMAKTIRQKENLWQLYGIYYNPLKAMHHIYALNPKSDLIPLLMVRNINIIETADLRFAKAESEWNYYSYQRDPFIDSNAITQQHFDYSQKSQVLHVVQRIIEERKVPAITPYLVSAAYLYALSSDYTEAARLCDEALRLSSNALIINQAEIIKTFVYVKQLNSINEEQELEIFKFITKIGNDMPVASRAKNAIEYIMYMLGEKYSVQQAYIKAELCYSSSSTFYKSSSDADEMIAFMERSNHNPFEKYMMGRYHLNADALYNIKGIKLLYEYNFAEALAVFEKIKTEETLPADPFTMRITDCHDCDFGEMQQTKYTRKTFAKKMMELQQGFETNKNKEAAAQNLFRYANALYNMTYFGNGRFIGSSPISWPDDMHTEYYSERKKNNPNYYDCNEALACYTKAQKLTTSKEFAARCAWGAAKCEHNLKLMEFMPWQSKENGDFEAGTYFNEMKSNYANTKYFKEVLNECGYFCTYITKDTACVRDKWSLRNR